MSSDFIYANFIYASHEAAELREELRLLKEKYEMLETGVEKLKSELFTIGSERYPDDDYFSGMCTKAREVEIQLRMLLKRVQSLGKKKGK